MGVIIIDLLGDEEEETQAYERPTKREQPRKFDPRDLFRYITQLDIVPVEPSKKR